MANTPIYLRRTATAGNVPNPAMLSFGELILNYQDGAIFFKSANGTGVHQIGNTTLPPNFGIVIANGTSLVSTTALDIFRLIAGNGMNITGLTANNSAVLKVEPEIPYTIAVSAEKAAGGPGTANVSFRWPFTGRHVRIPRAMLSVADTTNTLIDINNTTSSIFSTNLMIDATETTSLTSNQTAVLAWSTFTEDEICTIDIDAMGSAARGCKVTFYIKQTT